jgi:zinc transporter 1
MVSGRLCLIFVAFFFFLPVIESGMVLLQTVPTHVDLQEIEKKLLSIEGVQGVHEFHVWRLTGDRIIASAHITFTSLADYMRIASRVKKVFHDEGIHSTTIQPEALDVSFFFIRGGSLDYGHGVRKFSVKLWRNFSVTNFVIQ